MADQGLEPLIDPQTQALIDKYRQEQLLRTLAGEQEGIGNPTNMAQAIPALGKGFVGMMQGFKARQDAANQQSMASRLAGMETGGAGMPFPSYTPSPFTPAALQSSAPSGLQGMPMGGGGVSLIDPTYDPHGAGAGLQPQLADRVQDTLQDAAERGVNATVTSGYRGPEEQAGLYAKGRTAPGNIVTNAQPGSSYHNYGAAADVALAGGGPDSQYQTIGDAAKNLGLNWGGDFRSIKDLGHLQLPGSLGQIRAAALGSASPTATLAGGLSGGTDRTSQVLADIAAGETSGGQKYVGDYGSSFGPWQLHKGGIAGGGNAVSGLGDTFQQKTGLDPSDPSTVPAQKEFVAQYIQGKSDAEIKKVFHGYKPGATAAAGPSSYGVPKGMVAGPGVPSDVEPTTPEGRLAALTAARRAAAPIPPPVQQPQPEPMRPLTPTMEVPSPLSPAPVGPASGLTPPGAAGQAAAPGAAPSAPAAPPLPPPGPVTPPVASLQAAAPPVAARPAQIMAPAAGGQTGSAYDPRTGRFLEPGEQIPGYAPAPQRTGGLADALAGLFGGGAAQAAPAPRPAPMAPAGPPAGMASPAPQGPLVAGALGGAAPATAAPAPSQAPSGNPLVAQLSGQYQQLQMQEQQYRRAATAAAGTPYGQAFAKQADNISTQKNELYREGLKLAEEGYKQEQSRVRPMTKEEANAAGLDGPEGYMMNPNTGMPVKVAEQKEKAVTWGAPTPEQAARLPNGGAGYQVSSLGEIKPIAGGRATANTATDLVDKTGVPIDTSKPIEDVRAAAPPAVVATADAMRAGKQATPVGGGRNAAALYNQALILARQEEPGFDANDIKTRLKTRNDFIASSPNSSGGAIAALGTSLEHLASGIQTVDKLGNAQTGYLGILPAQWGNAVKNWRESGQGGPVGDAIVELQAQADRFNEEATKFYRGIGGSEADIKRGLVSWNPSLPPSQLRTEMQTQADLMMAKASKLQDRWHSGMGANEPDFPIVSPHAQYMYDVIHSRPAREEPPAGAAGPGPGPAPARAPPAPVESGPSGSTAPRSTEPYATQALRSGLSSLGLDYNRDIAKAQSVLPTGYGGRSSNVEENYANLTKQQQQFRTEHPGLAAMGTATVTAPAWGPVVNYSALPAASILAKGAGHVVPTAFAYWLANKLSGK